MMIPEIAKFPAVFTVNMDAVDWFRFSVAFSRLSLPSSVSFDGTYINTSSDVCVLSELSAVVSVKSLCVL